MAVKTQTIKRPSVPHINTEQCDACGLCARVCRTGTLFEENGLMMVRNPEESNCKSCRQCVMVCPLECIEFEEFTSRNCEVLPTWQRLATQDQLESLMLNRRSIRNFARRDVEREIIDQILQMTATAPISSYPSTVKIHIFHGVDKVKEFAEDIFLANDICFESQNKPENIEEWNREKNQLFYGAPLALYFHSSHGSDTNDNLITAIYAMLAAESLGLGTCLVRVSQFIRSHNKNLHLKYKIPSRNKPGPVLLTGYPPFPFVYTIRRELPSVVYV